MPATQLACVRRSKLSMGARSRDSAAEHSLLVSDFAPLEYADFDKWKPPTNNKLEPRPKYPPSMAQWKRCAVAEARARALILCIEYFEPAHKFIHGLVALHEDDSEDVSKEEVWDAYKELKWMWVEHLEQGCRRICDLIGNDNPDEQTLTFAALTPQPDGPYTFRMPTTFDLVDLDGHFQTIIWPRWNRVRSRALNSMAKRHAAGPRKAGDPPEEEEQERQVDPDKTGKNSNKNKDPKAAEDQKNDKLPYAECKFDGIGHKLARSNALTCMHKGQETPICWDWASHVGCKFTDDDECPHAHRKIDSLTKCHPAVRMALERRGGLKQFSKLLKAKVIENFAMLRKKMEAEVAKMKADPKAKGGPKAKAKSKGGKGKVGESEEAADKPAETNEKGVDENGQKAGSIGEWSPPAEYFSFHPTALERTLQEVLAGPCRAWLADFSLLAEHEEPRGEPSCEREAHRGELQAEIVSDTAFLAQIQGAPDYLARWIRGRILNDKEVGKELTVHEAVLEACTWGKPDLLNRLRFTSSMSSTTRLPVVTRLATPISTRSAGRPMGGSGARLLRSLASKHVRSITAIGSRPTKCSDDTMTRPKTKMKGTASVSSSTSLQQFSESKQARSLTWGNAVFGFGVVERAVGGSS